MTKELKFNTEARQKILVGVQTLANAVKVTLGPKGRNVIIEKPFGSPHITKDGVSVAKEVDLKDKFENIGAQMVKEVASKTADKAGDGTTTATVLAEAIYTEGLKHIAAGSNPMDLKRGMEKALKAVIEDLAARSKKIETDDEIKQIATISANSDVEIGEMIADAMKKVGAHGCITVEEAKGFETTLKVVEGMSFDRGYLSSYFMTNAETQECVYDDAYILLYDKKLSNLKDILSILQAVAQAGKPLIIIAEDIDGEALASLVVNRARGGFKVCAVKAPGFGDRKKSLLEDLAVLTGAKLISAEAGDKLDKVEVSDLGFVKKIIISKDHTAIIEGAGTKEAIEDRVKTIQLQLDNAGSEYDKEKLRDRIAKLAGGIAVISVGGATEIEMKERKDRVDDATHATHAAIEEGILPGGGVALVRAAQAISTLIVSDAEIPGVMIVARALSAPLRQIAENAGLDANFALVNVANASGNVGLNAQTGEYVDMVQAGIIDPTKVVRCAIQNAVSIASLLLTTECIISLVRTEKLPENKDF